MKSKEIRQKFLNFFASKQHKIVPSAPLVNKDDPTLMFINAGMNPFKDYFLGNKVATEKRIADTQKCLRVSGKHNDLEEVGVDSYHQTMFEMLGNWSFGDYFKREAIAWAWELLTEEYKIPKNKLYVTVFEGDKKAGLSADTEAVDFWKEWITEDRILFFDKKDNFWEMGDTGPCGPCSEIHVDLRSDEDIAKVDGRTLVNQDHPQVVEIWNLVFIQYNRKADGSLEELPEKHIDTGMGFERLAMALQHKKSNYDTDIFSPFIKFVEKESGIKYTSNYALEAKSDIAMRVIVDHLRAVAFAIADGQLPSNTGAGYVIRRILRRAVRYYYSFLNIKEPFLVKIIPLLVREFGDVFPEIKTQQQLVIQQIQREEEAFLKTLENGLKRFDNLKVENQKLDGKTAFELLATFGFPIDLTMLIASEKGWSVDEVGFQKAMDEHKRLSKDDAQKSVGDWTELKALDGVEFVGYDFTKIDDAQLVRYRTVNIKGKDQYQIVLDKTPFYAESGGQHGDTGLLYFGEEKIPVLDTQKENDLIIHIVKSIPSQLDGNVIAEVNAQKRRAVSQNHSAVHLMHAALHRVLGDHALQKGQDVNDKRIRFDFSHHKKMSEAEIIAVERIVNEKIRLNIPLEEERSMSIEKAKAAGAMMLFGEKYGDTVRMVTFDKDFSRELCGGTHVSATGAIGQFKILSESAIAGGVRRIEAITAETAENYIQKELNTLKNIRTIFKNPKDIQESIVKLQEENKNLQKQAESLLAAQATALKGTLKSKFQEKDGIRFLATRVPIDDSNALKTLATQLEKEVDNAFILFAAVVKGKPQLMLSINKELAQSRSLHAGNIVRELAKEIRGGGGGQAFFATAGGSDIKGLDKAVTKAVEFLNN